MDLLDRLLAHDAWTTGELIDRCAAISDAQLDQGFDLGPGSVRATLVHIVRNMEVWSDLMRADKPRTGAGDSLDDLRRRLAAAATDLATLAHDVRAREAWDELWVDHLDDPPREKTYGAAIAHVITHSMHHRAQVLHMLRRLGVDALPEGDVFSWEHRSRR